MWIRAQRIVCVTLLRQFASFFWSCMPVRAGSSPCSLEATSSWGSESIPSKLWVFRMETQRFVDALAKPQVHNLAASASLPTHARVPSASLVAARQACTVVWASMSHTQNSNSNADSVLLRLLNSARLAAHRLDSGIHLSQGCDENRAYQSIPALCCSRFEAWEPGPWFPLGRIRVSLRRWSIRDQPTRWGLSLRLHDAPAWPSMPVDCGRSQRSSLRGRRSNDAERRQRLNVVADSSRAFAAASHRAWIWIGQLNLAVGRVLQLLADLPVVLHLRFELRDFLRQSRDLVR